MKKTVKKNFYLTPAVKVVAFQVEGGFAPSDPVTVNVGRFTTMGNEPPSITENGTETFGFDHF
jgi:hypothetical protein